MRHDKEKAISMRLSGHSYLEIKNELNIPKSTLSSWLSRIKLPTSVRQVLDKKGRRRSIEKLIERNRSQTAKAIIESNEIRKKASNTISAINKNSLFYLGLALYWAEGYKRPVTRMGREITSHKISLTNSDPYLIKIFIKFLQDHLKITLDKIKISLRIFGHHDEEQLKRFWQKETGIPMNNFYKTYRGISISSRRKRPYNRLEHGVAQITVSNTKLFHKLMGYIEGIKKIV